MIHDSVREELALKISPISKTVKPVIEEKPILTTPTSNPVAPKSFLLSVPKDRDEQKVEPPISPILPKSPPTMQIMTKATSPTLVGFQNKNATVPDWRLQLQNSVRKRLDGQKNDETVEPVIQPSPRRVNLVTNGATALKAETVEEPVQVPPANPTVKNALKRIEESRRKYLLNEIPPTIPTPPPFEQTTVKQFPVNNFSNKQEYLPKQAENQPVSGFAKPNIFPFSGEVKVEKFDTNKLPPIPLPAKISSSFDKRPLEPIKIEFDEDEIIESQYNFKKPDVVAYSETEMSVKAIDEVENSEVEEDADDYAPIPLRFNAALFDLLICSFLSLILLSPFMLLNGRFFSMEGFLAFLATCSIVMFIYLTSTIGFLGRTFGMRIFSLEIVDVEANDYPTLHQAAVSSSVYLISLAFGGIGFLTMLINREKRAAHDLLSGTIIVKEY